MPSAPCDGHTRGPGDVSELARHARRRRIVNKSLTILLFPDEGAWWALEYQAMRTHAPISSSSARRLVRRLVGSPISAVERDLILETLAHTHGNRTVSARLLGVSVRSIRNKISEYSAEGFHIPRHENPGKSAETIVPMNTYPNGEATMPVAIANMPPVAASDCGS